MSSPKVSVLIPCYNAQKYVGETLQSVFEQTWKNLEVIVVDDGSEDGSVKEVERFVEAGVVIIQQGNSGASAARNRAFEASTGEFVQFLDADDLLAPDKIERQLGRLIGQRECVCSAEWGRFYKSPHETHFAPSPLNCDLHPMDWLVLNRLNMLFPAMWLVPRAVAEAAGPWDVSLSRGDDAEYFTRVLLASERVLFCEGARCYYRSGLPGSLSGSKSKTAWLSQYSVIELCDMRIRAREDSERTRRMFAVVWQQFAHSAYPYYPKLGNDALKRARALHHILIRPDGGPSFRLLSRLIGWRFARYLQVASGRN
jgi:glycosyltransferase involved in cell wall biosynthesis